MCLSEIETLDDIGYLLYKSLVNKVHMEPSGIFFIELISIHFLNSSFGTLEADGVQMKISA